MNKVEFAVCRIKEKLPRNQGLSTKGSGCVVHCETLTSSWGWKCNYFIVTPSVVLSREDLSTDKTFIAEFLNKDKRGLETFEVKQMAEVCKVVPGRSLGDDQGHYLSFISVEPLDKRGFLKKMVKKGSLQTFRPLDCVELHRKSEEEEEAVINEDLYCHVIIDLFNESTDLPFSTQTFKLVYDSQTRHFSVQDFGGSVIGFNDETSPIGAVVFTRKGEFAGVLDFADNFLSPVFLPESSMTEDSQNGDVPLPSNGENATLGTRSISEETQPNVLFNESNHVVKISIDGSSHPNNNEPVLSSEEFQPGIDLTNAAKSEAFVDQGKSNVNEEVSDDGIDNTEHLFQPDQESTEVLVSGNKKEELKPGNVLNSVNGTNVQREGESIFCDDTVEGHDRGITLGGASSGVTSFSHSGNEIITRNDEDFVTVIQVGDVIPAQKETTQQALTLNKNVEESDTHLPETSISEMSPAESQGLYNKEQSNMEDPSVHVDPSECVYIESEPVALDGSKPHDTKVEMESFQKQAVKIDDKNILTDDTALVTHKDENLFDSSERTSNTFDNSKISIHVTSPNEDALNEIKDSVSRPEEESEDMIRENSPDIHSVLTSEVSKETEVEEMGETAQSSANDGSETKEFTSDSTVNASLIFQKTDTEDNTDIVYKHLYEQPEEELQQRFDGNQTTITQKEVFNVTGEAIVSAELQQSCHDNKQHDQELLDTEMVSNTEPSEDSTEIHTVKHSVEEALSSNVVVMEKNGHDLQAVSQPATNVAKAEVVDNEVPAECSLDEALVVQRVDADSLLTETITNNPLILGGLGKCLDTEYQYGRVPCWRDLAELLDIPPEAYEHCDTFSATSPTEDLFVFLSATKPQLTIEDVKEALIEISRHDVAQYLDRKIAAGIISQESVVASLVEKDDTGILGRMALKLDRKSKNDWKGLALQLKVPHRVLRNFGSHQKHNSSLMLLKYIPIFDPEMTLEHVKSCLISIGRQDAGLVLDKAGIPGDEPVKNILDDSELLDQLTDLLNEDPPSPHWRHLAKELKIPQEKCKIFEPTEDVNSPTKMLFKSIEKCEPDLTFEELVLALVAMKRQDVLDVLQKYFSSDDVDQILEENNLLEPVEDIPEEIEI